LKRPKFILEISYAGAMSRDAEIFEFGKFVLIPRERQLVCGKEVVPLSGKGFDLLVALVRRHGRLVTKDELFDEVWPRTVVEEVNLSVNISSVRRALSREPNGAEMIQTVPKSGYRFIASVSVRDGTAPALPPASYPPTTNQDAYRLYLEGRYSWGQRSESGLRAAVAKFRQASALDPAFAAAHSGIADAYAALGYLSYMAPAEAFPEARRYAEIAIEHDARFAEPHASLAYVKFYYNWDWAGADAEFCRALALDPGWAAAHQWYSIYLLAAGRPTEALREIERARQREPLSLAIGAEIGFQ
jgi:DNA-binding winged helix-turn-helix (wHTH) protein